MTSRESQLPAGLFLPRNSIILEDLEANIGSVYQSAFFTCTPQWSDFECTSLSFLIDFKFQISYQLKNSKTKAIVLHITQDDGI